MGKKGGKYILVLLSVMLVMSGQVVQANQKKPEAEKKHEKEIPPIFRPVTPQFKRDFQKYCYNNSDSVHDAKFAWQVKTITKMEKQLKQASERLEKKKLELEKWVKRREEFIEKMTDTLVKIYSKMDPEKASAQISIMDYDTAVSLLVKLKASESSAILNEMKPENASQLIRIMVGATKSASNRETN